MNKKKIVIGIVICFVLLMILSFLMSIEKENQNESSMDGTTLEGQLLFSGMSVFSEKYIGDIKTSEITQRMQELIKKDIPELYEDIKKYDESKLKEYYSENTVEIKNKFGMQSENEFINFANVIKETDVDLNAWAKLKFNRESFIENSENTNYAYVEFEVIFKDEEKMTFSMYVANRKIMSPQFIFSAK